MTTKEIEAAVERLEPCQHRWSENGVYCCACGQRRVGADVQRIVTAAIWEARDLFRSRQHDNHEMAGAIINRTIDALLSHLPRPENRGDEEVLRPVDPRSLRLSIDELTAWDKAGTPLDEIKNWVSFCESVSLCLHELKRLRAVDTRPTPSGDGLVEALEQIAHEAQMDEIIAAARVQGENPTATARLTAQIARLRFAKRAREIARQALAHHQSPASRGSAE